MLVRALSVCVSFCSWGKLARCRRVSEGEAPRAGMWGNEAPRNGSRVLLCVVGGVAPGRGGGVVCAFWFEDGGPVRMSRVGQG